MQGNTVNYYIKEFLESNQETQHYIELEYNLSKISSVLGTYYLKNINEYHIKSLILNLSDQRDIAGSIDKYINSLTVFLQWAWDKEYLTNKTIYDILQLMKKQQKVTYLTNIEVQVLLKSLDYNDLEVSMACILALTVGLVSQDLLALHWEDLEYEEGTIIIHIRKTCITQENGECLIEELPKFKQYTRLVQSEELSQICGIHLSDGRIFNSSLEELNFKVNMLYKKLDLPQVGLIGLKHALIIRMLSEGMSVNTIAHRTRHKSKELRYTYINYLPRTEMMKII